MLALILAAGSTDGADAIAFLVVVALSVIGGIIQHSQQKKEQAKKRPGEPGSRPTIRIPPPADLRDRADTTPTARSTPARPPRPVGAESPMPMRPRPASAPTPYPTRERTASAPTPYPARERSASAPTPRSLRERPADGQRAQVRRVAPSDADEPIVAVVVGPPEGAPAPNVKTSAARSAQDAVTERVSATRRRLLATLRERESLRNAWLLQEVFGPPLALRERSERG